MQADLRLPIERRRKLVVLYIYSSCNTLLTHSYRHAVDGLWRVSRQEGVAVLWRGGSAVVTRAILMTIAQVWSSCDP